MQILVTYTTRTGNTKQLAEAIADGARSVDGVTCIVKPAAAVTEADFLGSAGIVAGSPVYFGSMSAELKDLFDRFVGLRVKIGDKVGAAFATSGDPTGGKETTMLSIIHAMLIYGMVVVGDPLDATGHYGVACVGAPDARTQDNARKLGRRVAQIAGKIAGR